MFGSLMRFGDGEEDDIFGAHMQNMNQMMNSMNSMFANPFGMMGGMPGGMPGMPGFGGGGPFMPPMMPQMPNMNQMMAQMQSNGNCHSYSSSSVMSMTNGPDGRPQVYQASTSTRSAPGGIKETKKAVCDSRTGVKKLAIGHAIGDKAHIIEREQNLRSGEQEERQDFINLDEEESDSFNKEWQQKARQAQLMQHSIEYPQHQSQRQEQMLALPDCNGSSSGGSIRQQANSSTRPIHAGRHHTSVHPYQNARQHHSPSQYQQSHYEQQQRQNQFHQQQQQQSQYQTPYQQLAIQASNPAGSMKQQPGPDRMRNARKPECNTTTAHNETPEDRRRPECNTTTPAPEEKRGEAGDRQGRDQAERPGHEQLNRANSSERQGYENQARQQYEKQARDQYENQAREHEKQARQHYENQARQQYENQARDQYEKQARQQYENQVRQQYENQAREQNERQTRSENNQGQSSEEYQGSNQEEKNRTGE